jgi:hypothetical protein
VPGWSPIVKFQSIDAFAWRRLSRVAQAAPMDGNLQVEVMRSGTQDRLTTGPSKDGYAVLA